MKVDIVLKVIFKGVLLFPCGIYAWTVPERVVELSREAQMVTRRAEPTVIVEEDSIFQDTAIKKIGELKKNPESDKVFFEKTQATVTLEEHVALEHHRALQFFDKKEFLKAEALLIEILDQMPRYHHSRIELAHFYLKEERIELAENLLLEGLKLDEEHPDFLRLMAMVSDRKGDPDKALVFLTKVKESRKQDKNYIALLGHIYQQTGRYSLARQQYFRLLEIEPKNPLWLLGVSIALDAEGQRDAALDGYQRLTAEGNVDPEILDYVRNRIDILQG